MRVVRQWFARGTALAPIPLLLSRLVSAHTPPPADSSPQQPDSGAPTSPLAMNLGDADLLFGGFIDATAIRRDANTGSGLGTSFGTILFGNTLNRQDANRLLSRVRRQ